MNPSAVLRRLTRALLAAGLLMAQFAAPLPGQDAVASGARVDSLVAAGQIQEAAWAARAAGDTARAETLLVRLDSVLRSTPLAAAPLSMDSQGVSYTFRLTYGGGVEAIFKVDGSDIFCTGCGVDREVAAYRVDRLLGADLTPMTVQQFIVMDGDTLTGSAMYFIRDASHPEGGAASKPDALHLFDAIIGNSDRHSANWLVRSSGGVVAIDHNRAFEYRPATRPKTCWESEVDALRVPGELGAVYHRYRTLPRDSLMAAVSALEDPDIRVLFVEMRDRVVARIEARVADPGRDLPREDCPAS
ncbi:MAG TPA: hypothetical protein VK966_11520 [Longimicrobiales bacterium]|nr:hypothetical protein [Longimicrobiales bacterium]